MITAAFILLAIPVAAINLAERKRRSRMTTKERQDEDNELQLW